MEGGATQTVPEVLLGRLEAGLREVYGEGRLWGLVLYGSYARGEANEGSDVDVLAVLEGPVEVGEEIRRSSGVVSGLSLESGRTLSVIPVSVEDYQNSGEPYLINARREGVLYATTGV